MNGYEFSLSGAKFDKMREALDNAIKNVFGIMQSKETDSAKIALTIALSTDTTIIDDPDAYDGKRDVRVPNVDYKIVLKTEIKRESEGSIVAGGNVVERFGDAYYIIPIEEAKGQTSMFHE